MEPDDRTEAAVREAFSLLDHEIRLEILLALLEDWHAVYTAPKSYAELMDAVGMRDSGKFNYHLDKLRGVYVRQVEDGYVPTASVTALYRPVLAHRPTERLEYEPTAIDSTCPRCDSAAILRYDRGFVSVECTACDDWPGFTYPFPKTGSRGEALGQSLERLPAAPDTISDWLATDSVRSVRNDDRRRSSRRRQTTILRSRSRATPARFWSAWNRSHRCCSRIASPVHSAISASISSVQTGSCRRRRRGSNPGPRSARARSRGRSGNGHDRRRRGACRSVGRR